MLCGALGPLLWLSLIVVAGAMRPGFSHVTQYISELGEQGSPTETLMRYAAFEFTGFLYLCFALILRVDVRNSRFSRLAACLIALAGLGRIGAGVFPCDPGCAGLSLSQNLPHFFATVGFGSGILATIVGGVIFRIHGWPKVFTGYSVGTGISALTFFLLLMTWSQNPMKTPGLFEHLATLILSLWLLVFAACLFRNSSEAVKSNRFGDFTKIKSKRL
jgi:hypothetical membrane protein